MRTDRHLAITLRKQGKSYNEISKELGIPESTLGYWLRGNQWSDMIKFFYLFLAKTIKISKEKIFIKLTLYPDLEDITYMKLWSNMLNIPLSQLKKSAVIRGRHPNRRLSYGICTVEIYSRKLKEKILEWIRLCKSDFNKEYLSMV